MVLSGNLMSNVELPKYKVIESSGNIELREYAPMIVAEVDIEGNRKEALNEGFSILADYIFGNNLSKKKIKMTTPVTNEPSEKIAMTAPVMQEKERETWKIRFMMPSEYTMETLPIPNSKKIHLISIPAKRFAVIRFSGIPGDEKIKKKSVELLNFIKNRNLNTQGNPIAAFYNPPWTLPFLRRNEVMIELRS